MGTILLAGTSTGILLALGLLAGGLEGGLVGLVVSGIFWGWSYSYSDRLIIRICRLEPLEDSKVQEMVASVAKEAKVPVPRLFICRKPSMNSMSFGNPKRACLAITEGLLRLENKELKSVIAHEISHIRNGDLVFSTLSAAAGYAVSYLGQKGYFNIYFWGDRGQRAVPSMLAMMLFALPGAFLVRLGVPKSREYKADWFGAVLIKDPDSMASALRKMSAEVREHPVQGFSAFSHLWMVNPLRNNSFNQLFQRHPPVEKRVERLEVIRSFERPAQVFH